MSRVLHKPIHVAKPIVRSAPTEVAQVWVSVTFLRLRNNAGLTLMSLFSYQTVVLLFSRDAGCGALQSKALWPTFWLFYSTGIFVVAIRANLIALNVSSVHKHWSSALMSPVWKIVCLNLEMAQLSFSSSRPYLTVPFVVPFHNIATCLYLCVGFETTQRAMYRVWWA